MRTLFLVGTTGTGKTQLATLLAQKTPKPLVISADSRQVFRGMDIVTGKDHPQDFRLAGIDLLNPDQPSSVSLWYNHVAPLLRAAQAEGRDIIVVGGTGFYFRALTANIATLRVPPNPSLRTSLASLTVTELQAKLRQLDPAKYASLNHSDLHNPRRLVRAIEVALTPPSPLPPPPSPFAASSAIGLYYADLSQQAAVIESRVLARLRAGAIKETQTLLSQYPESSQSLSALGYAQLKQYLKGELTKPQMIAAWVLAELQYAKRQLTYFRKQNVIWYDRGRMSIEEIYEHLSS